MGFTFRFVVAVSATVCCLSVPFPSQGQERVEPLLRSDTGLTGIFRDPLLKQSVWYDASSENGVLTLRLDLKAQSITLSFGQGEFHLNSSKNTAGRFSTLSGQEKETLRQLATYLDKGLETKSPFDNSVICAIRNLSSLPVDMPLAVSVDSVTKTVGAISISMEEIREAHRQALEELWGLPFDATGEVQTKTTYLSLCSNIGRTRTACYPTSIVPYRERCDNVLMGGTSCTGRCGTVCNGLCDGQKYTQDCHNHDRCADVYGTTSLYCNYIFPTTVDDCSSAPSCIDFPGVWTLTFKWGTNNPNSTTLNIFPGGTFSSADGGSGTWTVALAISTLTGTVGCKPIYQGTLSNDRLKVASGKMRCTIGTATGTWSASKTNGILPLKGRSTANDSDVAFDGRGSLSSPPN